MWSSFTFSLLSQVLYAMKEYACTAIDVIARRTRLGFLNVQAADEALPRIVQIMGKELDWSQERRTVRSHSCFTGWVLVPGLTWLTGPDGMKRRQRVAVTFVF